MTAGHSGARKGAAALDRVASLDERQEPQLALVVDSHRATVELNRPTLNPGVRMWRGKLMWNR